MIKRDAELGKKTYEDFSGGKGTLYCTEILRPEEMGGHGRKFSRTVLAPGVSIGAHAHNGDCETYYIVSGSGIYNDNGTMVPVSAGDMTFCADGEYHGLENTGTEPLVILGLILYTKA